MGLAVRVVQVVELVVRLTVLAARGLTVLIVRAVELVVRLTVLAGTALTQLLTELDAGLATFDTRLLLQDWLTKGC